MITFRPAVRVNTPLIIGLAGPTKSGKTYSAHRLAKGLCGNRPVIMINAEGARGHQYADTFTYSAADISSPYRPSVYIEALEAAAKLNPGAVIIDSVSHMHDGPGGILEWHEEILDERCGQDYGKRERYTFTAWVKPKSEENKFIYALLEQKCPIILCMRAKEKLKIVAGQPPKDLGWQPLVGERVAFETIFTLMLTPGCKGVPSKDLSDMRAPFDKLVNFSNPIDERMGSQLLEWSVGKETQGASAKGIDNPPAAQSEEQEELERQINDYRQLFREANTVEECNKLYREAPEHFKKAIHEAYSAQLKKFNQKKK